MISRNRLFVGCPFAARIFSVRFMPWCPTNELWNRTHNMYSSVLISLNDDASISSVDEGIRVKHCFAGGTSVYSLDRKSAQTLSFPGMWRML